MKLHLNGKKLKKIEVIIMTVLITILPTLFITKSVLNNDNYNDFKFIKITSLILALVFVFILLIQLIFRRPYLKIIFGCHSRIDRSVKCTHKHLGICARCLGIYLGIILMVFITRFDFNYLILLPFSLFLIIDGLLQDKTTYQSNNIKRLISGIMFGPTFVIIMSHYFLLNLLLGKLILNLF